MTLLYALIGLVIILFVMRWIRDYDRGATGDEEKRAPWLMDRTARWSLNNGMSGEWTVGDMSEREALNYVRKRLKVEGTIDPKGLDWLEIEFVEYWGDA